jgi:hypothetical protein
MNPSMVELVDILDRASRAMSVGDYQDFLERAAQEIQGRLTDPDNVAMFRGIERPRPGPMDEKVAGRHSKGSGA